MESLADGVDSLSKTCHSAPDVGNNPPSTTGTPRPSQPPSPKQSRSEGVLSPSCVTAHTYGLKTVGYPNGSVINQKNPNKTANRTTQQEEFLNIGKHYNSSNGGKLEHGGPNYVLHKPPETSYLNKVSVLEAKSSMKNPVDGSDSSTFLESRNHVSGPCKGVSGQKNSHLISQPAATFCASPQNSLYSASLYCEAKQSFTNTEVSECTSSIEKSGESGEVTNSCELIESSKNSIYRGSTGSDVSDESSTSSLSNSMYKPHKANDTRWEAMQAVRSHDGMLGINHFKLLRRLGCGDIGSVYLSELAGTKTYFAMKVMDKAALASRKKLLRAQTEREILQSLDHPFLPTLYTHFETDKFSCLVMEFCPGGDLHALRQKQPGKHFPEHAARFYVAEVLLALEYLHMLGIIYRDLKPENVLVREDGHIMLSDFDLSLRCAVSPTLVRFSNSSLETKKSAYCVQPACIEPACVMQPDCITPTCFAPRFLSGKPKKDKKSKVKNDIHNQVSPLPELIAEPTSARSMSFVGTHEYLAPEIIKGEGHGSAVDWWTFGIFLYELLYGKTPFKGTGNRATLFNVVGQPLRFPESPSVSFAARDLIRGLLVKEPQHRLAYRRGATEVKQHPFFQSVNWALIRCTTPPQVPKHYILESPDAPKPPINGKVPGVDLKPSVAARFYHAHSALLYGTHSFLPNNITPYPPSTHPSISLSDLQKPIVCRMRIAHPYPYRHHRPLSSLIILIVTQRNFSLISISTSTSTSTSTSSTSTRRPLLLLPPPRSLRTLTMASDDLSTLPAEDEKYGFQRSEMYETKLAGTVDAYDRHVFLCYKTPEAWPSRVEGSESDPLPKFFASALKARKNDIAVKTKLTVCEGREGTEFSDGDVLIFPEMIKYRGLKESDVDSFVDDVLVNNKPWASGVHEALTGSHVFVCAHGSRDRRCGVCGPVLIDKFREEAELRGLTNQVFVSPCSHIGGHKYAGNLIIYSPGSDGILTGHWYGYVTPDDVPELLDQHIGKGEIIERLWRGQMGVSSEEGEKINDQKLPNGEDNKKSEEKPQENGNQIQNNENFSGCCQGANGFTCCKDVSLEQNSGSEEKKLKETTEACGKKDALGRLSSLIGKWEQSDVLAAAAVVGAVATVAVAYSLYRRSG